MKSSGGGGMACVMSPVLWQENYCKNNSKLCDSQIMVEIFLKFYFRSLSRGGMGWEEWDDWEDWDFWERWEEWEEWDGGAARGRGKRK